MAANIANHLNADGGTSAGTDALEEEEQTSAESDPPPMAFADAPATGINAAPIVSSGIPVTEPITLDEAALSPMAILRPSFLVAVNNERMRLQRVRDDLGNAAARTRHCLTEHQERLNLLQKKVVDKSRSHDKAAGQFLRAREVCKAQKPPTRMSEQLVASWLEKVAVSYAQLQSWELKMKRQKEVVDHTAEELTAAEDSMKEKIEMLETTLRKLHSLATLLDGL